MLINIIILLAGFVLLIKGADFFVDGSSSVATRLKVSPLVIGLTLVAMGTSLPELSVSALASINGSNSLSISNAIGSNLFNLLVVLGCTALFSNIKVEKEVLERDLPVSIICALWVLLHGLFLGNLSRISGAVSLIVFVIYLINVVLDSKKNAKETEDAGEIIPIWKSIIFIVGGILAIKYGGDFVVSSATKIAEAIGISETLIGLTIVSVGTSLPELVTSLVAAKKGKVEMAVGNAVGSNIFNILLILGVASAISPIEMTTENVIDVAVLLVASLLGFVFCKTKDSLEKKEGMVMLAFYGIYLAYIIIR